MAAWKPSTRTHRRRFRTATCRKTLTVIANGDMVSFPDGDLGLLDGDLERRFVTAMRTERREPMAKRRTHFLVGTGTNISYRCGTRMEFYRPSQTPYIMATTCLRCLKRVERDVGKRINDEVRRRSEYGKCACCDKSFLVEDLTEEIFQSSRDGGGISSEVFCPNCRADSAPDISECEVCGRRFLAQDMVANTSADKGETWYTCGECATIAIQDSDFKRR